MPKQKHFDNIFFLVPTISKLTLFVPLLNKIYANKRMAPNNKWKFLTPLKKILYVTIRWFSQGRLTVNYRYTHRKFQLKFSALLKDLWH